MRFKKNKSILKQLQCGVPFDSGYHKRVLFEVMLEMRLHEKMRYCETCGTSCVGTNGNIQILINCTFKEYAVTGHTAGEIMILIEVSLKMT